MKPVAACEWALLLLAACRSGAGAPAQGDAGASVLPVTMTREQLRDPQTCKGCHPNHYREWSSSMHAYAARDPVFLAMNKRGQRETHGQLGDFCIKCHAPMAVVDKLTKDGLDLERLPDKERGVSCYFCHNVTGIDGDHNGMLRLANDTTMRGPIRDPHEPYVHRAEFSEMFEDTSPKSTAMCGGCHDIVTQTGVHLERTFQEYRDGIFSKSATGAPPAFDSCVGCHMPGQQAFAASIPGVRPAQGPRAPVARPRPAAHRLSSSRCPAKRRGGVPARQERLFLHARGHSARSLLIPDRDRRRPRSAERRGARPADVARGPGVRRERSASRPSQQRQHRGRRDRGQTARAIRGATRACSCCATASTTRRANRCTCSGKPRCPAPTPTATSRTYFRRQRRGTSRASTP